jgi:hypothetical protein
MEVTNKTLKIAAFNLSPNLTGEHTEVSTLIERRYRIDSESPTLHHFHFTNRFFFSTGHFHSPIGDMTGEATVTVAGMQREDTALSAYAVKVARGLHDYMVKEFVRFAATAQYGDPSADVRDDQLFTYIQMQNHGLTNPRFDHRGERPE